MAIKFVCSCGKRLRARDEMAARRSMCPRCGAPVGVPSLRPTHAGTAGAPMTPAERLRVRGSARPAGLVAEGVARAAEPAPAVSSREAPARTPPRAGARDLFGRPLDTGLVRLSVESGRTPRPPESHGYGCLLYPLRAWRIVLGLGAALTGLVGGTTLLLPLLLPQRPSVIVLSGLLGLVVALPILADAFALLDGALASGLSGDTRFVRWPGERAGPFPRCAAAGLVCFLAGPVFLIGGSFLYWVQAGDPAPVDWLILGELNVLALGYGLFALLAVHQRGRLRDANPVRVADVIHELPGRARLLVLVTAVLGLAHGLLAWAAVGDFSTRPGRGWFLLAGSCLSGLVLGTFLFRLLGVCCHRAATASARAG